LARLNFYPAGFQQFLIQYVFNLPVHTAELVCCPFFKGLIRFVIYPYDKAFLLAQDIFYFADTGISFSIARRKPFIFCDPIKNFFPVFNISCIPLPAETLCTLPYYYGSYFDGVAHFIIHFQCLTLQVFGPQRSFLFCIKWILKK